MNRNKKILLGLGCVLTLFVFLTFVDKYFGNVVEGLTSFNKNNYNYGMEQALNSLKNVSIIDHTCIDNMNNSSNVTNFIEKTKNAKDDITQAYDAIFPLIEGLKKHKKKKAIAVAEPVPVIVPIAAPVPVTVPVAPLSAEKQKAIDDALLKASNSFNEAVDLQKSALQDNPIESNKSIDLLTDGEKILYYYSVVLRGLKQSLDALNNR